MCVLAARSPRGLGRTSPAKSVCVLLDCNYGREDLLRLIFNMFDKDGSGTIDEVEFVELCTLVNNGSPVFPGNFKVRAL